MPSYRQAIRKAIGRCKGRADREKMWRLVTEAGDKLLTILPEGRCLGFKGPVRENEKKLRSFFSAWPQYGKKDGAFVRVYVDGDINEDAPEKLRSAFREKVRTIFSFREGERQPKGWLDAISPDDLTSLVQFTREFIDEWRAAAGERPIEEIEGSASGVGFPDPERIKRIEIAAVDFVKKYYQDRGWEIDDSFQKIPKCGFDVKCFKRGHELRLEVKGTDRKEQRFEVQCSQVKAAQSLDNWLLCVVTSALDESRELHEYTGKQFLESFDCAPVAFQATLRSKTLNRKASRIREGDLWPCFQFAPRATPRKPGRKRSA